jgi:hypothetical protein
MWAAEAEKGVVGVVGVDDVYVEGPAISCQWSQIFQDEW